MIRIALAGNPNCGKTTLFNALTGSSQFVGNWPGVTVEKKEGKLKKHDDVIITDLPGIYSLSPYTLEEVVARKYLTEERPEAILNIIDGTNLERNLYLTTQLLEIGIPVVIAINMMDILRKNGDKLDTDKLGERLGCRIFEISALKGDGIEDAALAAIEAAKAKKRVPHFYFSGAVEHALAHIEEATVHDLPEEKQRWYSVKLFERDEKVLEELNIDKETLSHIELDIHTVETLMDDDSEGIITNERYELISRLLDGVYNKKRAGYISVSDKIDRIVTNRVLALPIFAVIMFIVYYVSITVVGGITTDFVTGLFGESFIFFGRELPGLSVLAQNGMSALHTAPWLNDLVANGIIKGVGSVLSFVPQMMALFIFLAFLEACGYMSRIAFMMDKLFRKFGLSGKSFIPMLIGTGCGVPGIMASRTIENVRDRRMTIITTTFIPCGAKLPVIALIASSLFNNAWWVAPSAYFAGVIAIIVSGVMLKKTKMFSGNPAPFVMELPAYHWPTFVNLLRSMWERTWSFIKKAGTVILLASIVIWAGSRFGIIGGMLTFSVDMSLDESLLGYLGLGLKWVFAPLGFGNTQASIASLMGILAKEEIVSVFHILGFTGLTALSGYSFLLFNLLCAPCMAAISAIGKEMNSAKWTLFAVGYQCAFAYAVSLIIYQFGLVFSGNMNIIGFIFADIILGFIIYMLIRRQGDNKKAGKAPASAE